MREIKQYISAAYELSGQWADAEIYRAIDEQLLQKVLPKIHGNRKEIGTMPSATHQLCFSHFLSLLQDEEKLLKQKRNRNYAG